MKDRSLRPLDDTLESLGIEELKERLEISSLLAGAGGGDIEGQDIDTCCSCKIPPDEPTPHAPGGETTE